VQFKGRTHALESNLNLQTPNYQYYAKYINFSNNVWPEHT
jgi:hypothetical protein